MNGRKWRTRPWRPGDGQDAWGWVVNMIPNSRGHYVTPWMFTQDTGAGPAAPGTTLNVWSAYKPNGVASYYVGTTTKLYDATAFGGVAPTDRSRGGGYTNTATYWSFAQFGFFSIATNGVDAPQVRDATGAAAFANLAGTPPTTAKIAVVQSNVLLFFNTNSGGHYWAASNVGNHADFTTGDATSGFIAHRPGAINAAIAFKGDVIVFKQSSVYRMRYVGSPYFWTVELLVDGIGCDSAGGVVNCGDVLVFTGYYGQFVFDGSAFRPADDGFFCGAELRIVGVYAAWYNPLSATAFFAKPNGEIYAYNLKSDRWGWFGVYQTTGTARTSHRLGTGEPFASVAYSVYPPAVDYSVNPSVLVSTSGGWGNAGASVQLDGYMGPNNLGNGYQGRSQITRVVPVLSDVAEDAATTITAATGSQMTCSLASRATMNSLGTEYLGGGNCSTDLCRLDCNFNARFLDITFASNTAPFSILDVIVDGKFVGEN